MRRRGLPSIRGVVAGMRRMRRHPLSPDPSYDEVAKKVRTFVADAARQGVVDDVEDRVRSYIDTFPRSLEEGAWRVHDAGLTEIAELKARVVALQSKLAGLRKDTRRDLEIVEKAEAQALEAIEARDSMPRSGLPLRERNV